jgi:thioredoxin 1
MEHCGAVHTSPLTNASMQAIFLMGFSSSFLTTEPARTHIDAAVGPLILEFGTAWCGHCRAAQPLIAQAFAEHPEIAHMKVEDGPGQPLGRSFGIKLWPTLIFLKDGREISRAVRPGSAATILAGMRQIAAGSDQA